MPNQLYQLIIEENYNAAIDYLADPEVDADIREIGPSDYKLPIRLWFEILTHPNYRADFDQILGSPHASLLLPIICSFEPQINQNIHLIRLLQAAIEENSIRLVKKLLARPDCPINIFDENKETPLTHAMQISSEISALIISDPRININLFHEHEWPILCEVSYPRRDVFFMLLQHPYIDLNAVAADGYSAYADTMVDLDINRLEWLFSLTDDFPMAASHINLEQALTKPEFCSPLTIEQCLQLKVLHGSSISLTQFGIFHGCYNGIKLLERFTVNPHETRLNIWRRNSDIARVVSARLYTLIVCVTDGYFSTRQLRYSAADQQCAQFFKIAATLPLDLQMVLCMRATRLSVDVLPQAIVTAAFDHMVPRMDWRGII